jgi:glycosyltransferase involved in cell wall biosynthesis
MTAQTPSVSTAKIYIVAPAPPPYGGMSIQAEKLAARLNSEGLNVQLLPTNPIFPRPLRFAESVPALRTIIRTLLFLRSLARILPHSDVIHHFSVCGLYFFTLTSPLILLARSQHKRMVLNYRGGRAPAFLRKWSSIAIPIMRRAHSVIVPSVFLQRTFEQFGLPSSVVPNIIETESFCYRERHVLRPSLLVTRQLEPLYNIDGLLRAFRIIQDRYPQAELTIAGTGSEGDRLRKLCVQLKLTGVDFLGYVSTRDLPALYAAHDIFVNASNADNFPAALVEAACSGLPIVTTAAGGIPDMLQDRKSGLLVSLNDHEALAAGVIELLKNPEMARHLARVARSWAEQVSWPATLASLLHHYGLSEAKVQ